MEPGLRLTEGDKKLLRRVISERSPRSQEIIENLDHVKLSFTQREKLRDILSDEFVEKGLKEDDEPNQYGLQIDDIIGKLRVY